MEKRTNKWNQTGRILLLAVICTVLWGSAFPSIKLGYEWFEIAPQDIPAKILFAGYRFFLAGIFTILAGIVSSKKWFCPTRQNIGVISLLGLVQTGLQYLLFYIGLSNTTGVKGAILSATGAFIAVILAHFFYRDDRLTVRKILGCLAGFGGVVLLNASGGELLGGFSFFGEGFMMLSAASFAVGSLISKRAAQTGDPVTITGYQLLIGGGALILAGILSGGRLTAMSVKGIALLGYLALLSAVAFVLWTLLLKYNPVGKISVYNFLTPIFGALLSAVILGEELWNLKNLGALLLVCGGIVIVNFPRRNEGKG